MVIINGLTGASLDQVQERHEGEMSGLLEAAGGTAMGIALGKLGEASPPSPPALP